MGKHCTRFLGKLWVESGIGSVIWIYHATRIAYQFCVYMRIEENLQADLVR